VVAGQPHAAKMPVAEFQDPPHSLAA
jgi:hypothetical protein